MSGASGAAMNVAGLAINIPGVIDVCIKLGTHIADIIAIYRKANAHAEDIAHQFDVKWNNIVDILDGVRIFHMSLGDVLKAEILAILNRLRGLLYEAINEASLAGLGLGYNPTNNPVIQLSTNQAVRFSAYKLKKLKKLLNEAERWENAMFKRLTVIGARLHLAPKLAKKVAVLEASPIPRNPRTSTRQSLQFPQTDVVLPWRPPTDLFVIKFSKVSRSISHPEILVEFRYYDTSVANIVELETNVYGMVKMLKSADARLMSILKCQGVYPSSPPGEPSRFELQYCLPDDLDYPRSLRDLLTDRTVKQLHPLNHRFRLANHLAASVLYVHSGQFVHKCIKPENILIMTKAAAPPTERFPHVLGWPFLVGFDRCRPASAHSGRYGEINLEDSLYQHPTRWGVAAEEAFAMQHDIYSLGVVLLEIGLWRPLVWYNELRGAYEYSDLFTNISETREITTTRTQKPAEIKQRLINIAKEDLPSLVGETYSKVVLSCLEIHDDGMIRNENFGRSEDGDVGTMFIKHVIKKLEGLNVI
jgi:hypothetical protein